MLDHRVWHNPPAGQLRAPVDPVQFWTSVPRSITFRCDEEEQQSQFHFRGDEQDQQHLYTVPLFSPYDHHSYTLFPPCEEEHVAKPASAQMLQGLNASSFSKKFIYSVALEKPSFTATYSPSPQPAVAHDTLAILPPSQRCLSPSPGSPILGWNPPDSPTTFYIRIDLRGSFHTYPHVGGPLKSLLEVENAINCYLQDRRDPKMCKEQNGVSPMEMVIRQCLYWPDGTRKKCSKSQVVQRSRDRVRRLVQALLDQYNEDHNLLGDLAYELKDVLHNQYISETHVTNPIGHMYYHLNFTTKTKGADDLDCGIDSLFFVEVTFVQGEREKMVVSCFCMLEPNDNGHCYGCTNNGSVDMKHPNKANAYVGGHEDEFLPYGAEPIWSDNDDNEEAEESRIRQMFEVSDFERRLVEELRSKDPRYATPMM